MPILYSNHNYIRPNRIVLNCLVNTYIVSPGLILKLSVSRGKFDSKKILRRPCAVRKNDLNANSFRLEALNAGRALRDFFPQTKP